MTEKEAEELGRRAVACAGWRWLPGMVVIDTAERTREIVCASWLGYDGMLVIDTDLSIHDGGCEPVRMGSPDDFLPDLTAHATLGCLLALVREAWGRQASTVLTNDAWVFWDWDDGCGPLDTFGGDDGFHTEAEALVAALEAAPC